MFHHFGASEIELIDELLLFSPDVLKTEEYFPQGFKLYNRSFNDEYSTWEQYGEAARVWSGKKGAAQFLNIAPTQGQFSLCRENILRNDDLEIAVSIEDQSPSFSLFPNPCLISQKLNIRSKDIGDFVFDVYNAEGKKMHRFQISETDELSVSDLLPGIYFYQVIGKHKMINGSFIIE